MTQHAPVHHPKNPILGFHGWDETVPQGSVYVASSFFLLALILFLGLFFSLAFFFLVPPSLNPKFFLGTPTYSSNLPTSIPPPNPSTYPTTHLRSPTQSFKITENLTESLWSLGRETSSKALALNVSVFFPCFQNQVDKLATYCFRFFSL